MRKIAVPKPLHNFYCPLRFSPRSSVQKQNNNTSGTKALNFLVDLNPNDDSLQSMRDSNSDMATLVVDGSTNIAILLYYQ